MSRLCRLGWHRWRRQPSGLVKKCRKCGKVKKMREYDYFSY